MIYINFTYLYGCQTDGATCRILVIYNFLPFVQYAPLFFCQALNVMFLFSAMFSPFRPTLVVGVRCYKVEVFKDF